MIGFLNGLHMLSVIKRIAYAWDQISAATIRKSWNKIIPDTAPALPQTSAEVIQNYEEFVNDFAELNIVVGEEDEARWFAADGLGYERLNEEGIVELVNAAADDGEESGEEDLVLEDRNSSICPVSHAEAMQMFDGCSTWLRAQPEASVENTSTLVMLRELAAQKQEASRKQSDIRSFFA